jgi:hypothetical protein
VPEKRIASVTLCAKHDDVGDISELGTFTNTSAPGAVDRKKAGTWRWNEYRYFVPETSNYEGSTKAELRQYRQEDWQRAEAWASGEWWYMGIYAEAEVYICGVRQVLRSPGLWGIESDSDASYFDDVIRDEVYQLREVCAAVGIDDAAFDAAEVREPRYQNVFGVVAGTTVGGWVVHGPARRPPPKRKEGAGCTTSS